MKGFMIQNERVTEEKDKAEIEKEYSNKQIVLLGRAKRARKKSAKPLPQGITQEKMKKYVVYYHEYLDKDQKRSREYFKIEKHPKLDKIFIGSKSSKLSIQDKLKEINKMVEQIENDAFIHPKFQNV